MSGRVAGRAGEGSAAPAGVVTGPRGRRVFAPGLGGRRGPGRDRLEGLLARSPAAGDPLVLRIDRVGGTSPPPVPRTAWGPGEAPSFPGG